MLGSSVDNNIKQKIQNASSEGKSDISSLVKDKTIGTVLNDTLKNLANGAVSKNNVFETLQNSKGMFELKNFSNDVKTVIAKLEQNPAMEKQAGILKEMLVNVKNLDDFTLKTNLLNNGVGLESKIKELATTLKDPSAVKQLEIQKAVQSLLIDTKNALKQNPSEQSLNNIKQTLTNLSNLSEKADIKLEVKNAIAQLLNNSKNLSFDPKLQQQPNQQSTLIQQNPSKQQNALNQLLSDIKTVQKEFARSDNPLTFTPIQKSIGELSVNLKSFLQNNSALNLPNNINLNLTNISNTLQKTDLPAEIKTAISNLLTNINSANISNKPLSQNQTTILNQVLPKLEGLTQKVLSQPLNNNLKELSSNIKALVQSTPNPNAPLTTPQVRNQNMIEGIKQSITNLGNQIIKADIPVDIKNQINNIFTTIKSLNIDTAITKDVVQQKSSPLIQITNQFAKIDTGLTKIANPVIHTAHLLDDLASNFKEILANGTNQQNIIDMKTIMTNLNYNTSKPDMPAEVKTAVSNLLNNISTMNVDNKLNMQATEVKNILVNIEKVQGGLTNIINSPQNTTQNLNLSQDIKAVLLQLSDGIEKGDVNIPKEIKPTVEKLLTQIEFYQALSVSSASNISYLPFSWDELEEGDIKINKTEDNGISCQINLNLKDIGEIRVLLQLDKKNNIQVNMAIQENNFKSKVQDNLQDLRQGIYESGLNLQSLNVFDMGEHQKTAANPYANDSKLNFGLDLKV
jgi:hypothetical protein